MTPKVLDLFFEGRKVFYDRKGYPLVWVDGKSVKLHVLVWERANGPKPKGYEIHHRDEDKTNYDLTNLVLLSPVEHQRTHAGWIKTGDTWSHKPCTACKQLLPLDAFYPRKGYTPSARCKPCHCAATQAWQESNPETRKEIALRYYYKAKAIKNAA